MKKSAVLLIPAIGLLPLLSFPQDCVIQREEDPYTKEIKLSTGFMSLRNATLSIQADSREIDFLFVISGNEKCFSDASTAFVYFEGTKVKTSFRNLGGMNCDGFFHFIFKNQAATPSALHKLATEKITSILFIGADKKESQITFSAEHQVLLKHLVGCLIEEARTLLPKQ